MSYDGQIPHLVPMDADVVNHLCDLAQKLAFDSYTVRAEIDGFRKSRTPWDAQRLANALAIDYPAEPIVKDLDKLAHDRAGLAPAFWRAR